MHTQSSSLATCLFSWALLFFLPGLSEQCRAADGPENTGTLTISKIFGNQLEANFQVDRKIFHRENTNTNSVPDIAKLIAVESDDSECAFSQNAVIESAEVLTANLVYSCFQEPIFLEVRLRSAATLPERFTLGFRTPIDHFVLSKDAPTAKTIISVKHAFGLAGMAQFLNHSILEKTHIGRPHAFFFGGLSVVPPGFYFLFLFAALSLTKYDLKLKVVTSFIGLVSIAAVTTYVINTQSSLSFLPVNILGMLYLGCSASVLLLTFARSKSWTLYLSLLLLVAGFVFTGLEFAVMLRWLEGQEAINTPLTISFFFLGLTIPLAFLGGTAILATAFIKKSKYGLPALTTTRVVVLTGTLYTLAVLVLKLP